MSNRIFIDMDGVLAKFNHVASEEQLYEQGYFLNLEPMPTVIDGIKQYIAEHPDSEVHILSAYLKDSPYALQEKNQWLDRYLPEIDAEHRIFCPCGEPKANYIPYGIEDTDILLDDYTKNLLDWQQQGGQGIKLLNGINHTQGTWQGFCVDYQDNISFALQDAITVAFIKKEHNKANGVIEINRMNFPDDIFREHLKEQFGSVLTQETIKSTKQLILAPIDEGHPGICDLTGIEYFTALEILDCNHHSLTKLDVSRNSELRYLDCGYNHLTDLDVSNNSHLTELICYSNNLKSIDVSNNPSLTYLNCASNHLTELNLNLNPLLKELKCGDNMLHALELGNNTNLIKLWCFDNALHTLDLSKNTNLIMINCSNNQLNQLNISQNTALELLGCEHNNLSSIDIAHNPALEAIYCTDNMTGMYVDMSHNPRLYDFDFRRNNPGVIPITKWPEIRETSILNPYNVEKKDNLER